MTDRKTTPIWLLDVDGVLNALPWRTRRFQKEPLEPAWPDYTQCRSDTDGGDRYVITYSPTLMKAIRELHESGAVEVRWLTTWGRGANFRLNKQLGLPEFAVAGEPDIISGFAGAPAHHWWKLDDARRAHAAEPHRPFIWTDDDLAAVKDARDWAGDNGVLAIATDDRSGITPHDLERITNFVHSQNAMVA